MGVCQDDCILGENSIDPLQVSVANKQWTLGIEGLGLDCEMTPSQSQSFPFTCKYELHTPNYSTFFYFFAMQIDHKNMKVPLPIYETIAISNFTRF